MSKLLDEALETLLVKEASSLHLTHLTKHPGKPSRALQALDKALDRYSDEVGAFADGVAYEKLEDLVGKLVKVQEHDSLLGDPAGLYPKIVEGFNSVAKALDRYRATMPDVFNRFQTAHEALLRSLQSAASARV